MYKISNNSEVVIFLLGEMRWNDSYVRVRSSSLKLVSTTSWHTQILRACGQPGTKLAPLSTYKYFIFNFIGLIWILSRELL